MTEKQQKALAALITYPTREKAAEAAGITSKTLRKYLQDPEFKAAYARETHSIIDEATRQAQGGLSPALEVMREMVESDAYSPSVRISAARTLLEYGLRLTEITDILRTLEEAEGNVL